MGRKSYLVILFLFILIGIYGCNKNIGLDSDSVGFTQADSNEKKEETKEDETETVEEELIQTEESSSEQSIEDEETDNKIIIDIQNTEIYINNVKIVYENTDDLEGKLKKELESMVSDKSEVYMKSQDGNYDLHEKIEGILNELGIKWVEVMESTE